MKFFPLLSSDTYFCFYVPVILNSAPFAAFLLVHFVISLVFLVFDITLKIFLKNYSLEIFKVSAVTF